MIVSATSEPILATNATEGQMKHESDFGCIKEDFELIGDSSLGEYKSDFDLV